MIKICFYPLTSNTLSICTFMYAHTHWHSAITELWFLKNRYTTEVKVQYKWIFNQNEMESFWWRLKWSEWPGK